MADEQFPAAATALEEYQSIEEQMASPEVVSNPDKLRKLGRRHAELGAIVGAYKAWLQVKDDLAAAQEMAGEDADFAEEAKRLEDELPGVEEKLRTALIPRDPDDARDTIMEIKAGTGGEEAALFAGDLLRMYTKYIESKGWKYEITCSASPSPNRRAVSRLPLPASSCSPRPTRMTTRSRSIRKT